MGSQESSKSSDGRGLVISIPDDLDNGSSALELSPPEQNAPRRFKRICMALKRDSLDNTIGMQTQWLRKAVTDAFSKTLQHWPFLAGTFQPLDDKSTKVQLVYHNNMSHGNLDRILDFKDLPASNTQPIDEYPTSFATFGRGRFLSEADPAPGEPFPPVTLRVSYTQHLTMLGFAFSQVIFDGEFIHNFFRQFSNNTLTPPAHPPEGLDLRALPQGVPGGKVDMSLFDCYKWDADADEEMGPEPELIRNVVPIDSEVADVLFEFVNETIYNEQLHALALPVDVIGALFWVAIMRARHSNGCFDETQMARLNITVPGDYNSRVPARPKPRYFGNSTVTNVAQCPGMCLLQVVVNDDDGYYETSTMHSQQLGAAAMCIRGTLSKTRANYLRHSISLKRSTDPEDERRAYRRSGNWHTDSLSFEDWTWYGAEYGIHLPGVDYHQPTFFPCHDDMEEGQIIIMPRNGHYSRGSQWNVCLCLARQDMNLVLKALREEGWSYSKIPNLGKEERVLKDRRKDKKEESKLPKEEAVPEDKTKEGKLPKQEAVLKDKKEESKLPKQAAVPEDKKEESGLPEQELAAHLRAPLAKMDI